MRVSREAAQASKARITPAAARLMRENGIGGTSVADVMAAAGMTTGGFYKHFDSKDDLTAAAVREAFAGLLGGLARSAQAHGQQPHATPISRPICHRPHVESRQGCPGRTLGPDAARAGQPIAEPSSQVWRTPSPCSAAAD